MLKPVMVDENEVDRDLLARVREGDDSAYGELFSRHADAIRRFSLRHVREAAEADDLTAEAFFRMLQAIRRGSGPTDHVRTYLLTVARRVAWEWSGRRRDVPVEDEELGRPMRMQNIVGRFSRTPAHIRTTGPRLGQANRQVLVDELGFDAAELAAAGIAIDGDAP